MKADEHTSGSGAAAAHPSGPYAGVAVMVPCYNEELTVARVVGDFARALPGAQVLV